MGLRLRWWQEGGSWEDGKAFIEGSGAEAAEASDRERERREDSRVSGPEGARERDTHGETEIHGTGTWGRKKTRAECACVVFWSLHLRKGLKWEDKKSARQENGFKGPVNCVFPDWKPELERFIQELNTE